jgi:hypothetical protein
MLEKYEHVKAIYRWFPIPREEHHVDTFVCFFVLLTSNDSYVNYENVSSAQKLLSGFHLMAAN